MDLRIRSCLLLVFLLLTQAAFAPFAAADDPAGKLEHVAGGVHLLRGGKTLPAKLADPVFVGDTLNTAANSNAVVRFVDETQLVLGPSSQAKVDAYVYEGPSSKLLFKFAKGSFRAVTGKIVEKNPQAFNMQTPLATLGIRGSDVFALVSQAFNDVGALDLGPGHTLQVQGRLNAATIAEGGLVSRVTPDGRVAPPIPISPTMFNVIVNTLAPPQAPPIRPLSLRRMDFSKSGTMSKESSSKLERASGLDKFSPLERLTAPEGGGTTGGGTIGGGTIGGSPGVSGLAGGKLSSGGAIGGSPAAGGAPGVGGSPAAGGLAGGSPGVAGSPAVGGLAG
ncbi:MAG: FecR family protein, partial [Proteobacteria bacterium]|nr:FecR family protein [Pseudomonadota bacterium]MBU1595522.1 FecR family protein [Pseudomonadota bacterium]